MDTIVGRRHIFKLKPSVSYFTPIRSDALHPRHFNPSSVHLVKNARAHGYADHFENAPTKPARDSRRLKTESLATQSHYVHDNWFILYSYEILLSGTASRIAKRRELIIYRTEITADGRGGGLNRDESEAEIRRRWATNGGGNELDMYLAIRVNIRKFKFGSSGYEFNLLLVRNVICYWLY